MNHSTDSEIRTAFHTQKLKTLHQCSNTIVIDELGVAHGKKRIDIAVLNGHIHGYEIKSSKDNLLRLPEQIHEYSQCMEKLTIITAPSHLHETKHIAPSWCGLIIAEKGNNNQITFSTERQANQNPNIDLVALSHLLWRKEAVELLSDLGVEQSKIKGSRLELYHQIAYLISLPDLTNRIKQNFIKRENWRVDQPLKRDGDSLQLASM